MRIGLLAAAGLLAALLPAGAGAAVTLSTQPGAIRTALGRSVVVRSTIANPGAGATAPLIAHLNVLSLAPGLYVDPEDWSSQRTRYLPPIPAHGSVAIRWKLTAVSPGRIGVYVAVLPRSGARSAPLTGPLVRVAVADRSTLDAGNILPLSLGVPALVGLAALGVRRLRRRG